MAVGNIRSVSAGVGAAPKSTGTVGKIQTERSANYEDVLKKYKDMSGDKDSDEKEKKNKNKKQPDEKKMTQGLIGRRMIKSKKLSQKQLLDELRQQQNLIRNKIEEEVVKSKVNNLDGNDGSGNMEDKPVMGQQVQDTAHEENSQDEVKTVENAPERLKDEQLRKAAIARYNSNMY